MRSVAKLLLCGIGCLAVAGSPLHAGVVRSPDVAHTFALASIIGHQLRWIPSERALVASITFSNINYVSRTERLQEERYDFFLPGVHFDAGTGIFYDPDNVPVAALRREIIGSEILLLPGAKIDVTNRSGTVRVSLSATRQPRPGLQWVQIQEEALPPNLLG